MDEHAKSARTDDSEALARRCVSICEDRKAEDVQLFDVRECSILADYYIICTGTSAPHLSAICNRLRQELAAEGMVPRHHEGDPASHWVIMDYGDVLIHVLDADRRRFYRIEELWQSGHLVYQSQAAESQFSSPA